MNELINDESLFAMLRCNECVGLLRQIEELNKKVESLTTQNNFLIKWGKEDSLKLVDSDSQTPVIDCIQCQTGNVQSEDPAVTPSATPISASAIAVTQQPNLPYTLLPGTPFSNTSVESVCQGLTLTSTRNRSVAYFGLYPYSYSNVHHPPCPLPSDSSLLQVVRNVKSLYPTYQFNSALVTRFGGGGNNLPYHSDNEQSIDKSSQIVTVVLGDNRPIKFRDISNKSAELMVAPAHGQVYTMSRQSQDYFQHCVPQSHGTQTRVSITLRLLTPPENCRPLDSETFLNPPATHLSPQPTLPSLPSPSTCTPGVPGLPSLPHPSPVSSLLQPSSRVPSLPGRNSEKTSSVRPTTLYISSSMFRFMKAEKLSSSDQEAHVFYYRGADAAEMLSRFQRDSDFVGISEENVTKVFLLMGSNNVDRLKSDNTDMGWANTTGAMREMLSYLFNLLPNATINVINILPRSTYDRNVTICQMNEFLYQECQLSGRLNYVNTESERKLFSTRRGFRNNLYFISSTSSIPDNVHLNSLGLIRLAKHLKYLAHR